MPNMSDLAIASASLKAAKDIAQGMASLQDAASLHQKQVEFQSKLLDATSAVFAAQEERSAMLERIRELKKEVARLESWEDEKQRYELVSLAPNMVAYAPKESMRGTEPPHYLCANCFAAGKKSFLQQRIRGQSLDKYICNSCNEELPIHKDTPPQRSALPPGRGGRQGWMGR